MNKGNAPTSNDKEKLEVILWTLKHPGKFSVLFLPILLKDLKWTASKLKKAWR